MRVKISKYRNYVGPTQIAEKILFWKDPDSQAVDKLSDWLAYGSNVPDTENVWSDRNVKYTWFTRMLQWINQKLPDRVIKVRIDPSDTWNMSNTLGYIILPMLKQLNEKKHGAPFTDDEDVPEELRSTSAPPKENDWDTDANHFARWDWIMEEMIWAFEQHNEDWESQFHTGKFDRKMIPVDKDGNTVEKTDPEFVGYQSVPGPNDTHVFDAEGYKAHQARMVRGFTLFGKYFINLWD